MSPRTYEEEPQVSEYRRSVSRYDEGDGDRELTLSTPTILGLFFALAMVCACFFGLGYAMGHKTPVAESATPQVFDAPTAPPSGAPKPAPGSATTDATPSSDAATAPAPDATASGTQTATVPLAAPLTAPAPASATHTDQPASTRLTAPQSAPASVLTPAAKTTPAAAVPPGNFVVQVAAVSSQDVANILLSTLQKKGYAVAVRREPQDQLLHVQIGPFPDRKDAEAMRQRVLADGFNAIVK